MRRRASFRADVEGGRRPVIRRASTGLELRTTEWEVRPFDVERVRSSFFADPIVFPCGSVRFDHALIMRGIAHTWHPLEPRSTEAERVTNG